MERKKRIMTDLQPRKKHYDPEIKLRILCAMEQGIKMESITASFGITRQTIHDWRKRYDAFGLEGLEEGSRRGRPSFLTDKQIQKCVENITTSNKFITAKLLRDKIYNKHSIRYSKSGIRYILAKNGLTYKKLDSVHANAATNNEAEQWRKKNIPKIRRARAKGFTLMTLDEAKSELDSGSRYGYARRGKRLYSTYHGKRQQIGIFGAIAENGKSVYRTAKKFNSKTFESFLDKVHARIGNAVIILDNARYHNSKKIQKYLETNPGILLIYLPTGSPHMNSIENVWGAEKMHLGNIVFYDFGKFKRHVMQYLRRYKFNPDMIYKKLFSRLPDQAEACIREARRQRKIITATVCS